MIHDTSFFCGFRCIASFESKRRHKTKNMIRVSSVALDKWWPNLCLQTFTKYI